MKPSPVFTLPGWQGSGPDHWQSRWEALYGCVRVEQSDWMRPLRGDWIARLEDVLLASASQGHGPAVLVAHSLGCIQIAAWAAHTSHPHLVQAALLVAPGDVEREDLRQMIPGWAPIERERLPFRSLLLSSQNDPYCSQPRAQSFAQSWGARFVDYGDRGHINAESGLGDWPEGVALMQDLLKD